MFVQIIEGKTKDVEGLMRQGERWQSEVGAGRGRLPRGDRWCHG